MRGSNHCKVFYCLHITPDARALLPNAGPPILGTESTRCPEISLFKSNVENWSLNFRDPNLFAAYDTCCNDVLYTDIKQSGLMHLTDCTENQPISMIFWSSIDCPGIESNFHIEWFKFSMSQGEQHDWILYVQYSLCLWWKHGKT